MVVLDTAMVATVQSDGCQSRLDTRRNGLPDIFAGVNMEAIQALAQASGVDMTTADDSSDVDSESDIDSGDPSEIEAAAEAIYARPLSRRCALSDIFELITPAQRCELMNEYYSSLEGHSSDCGESDCCEKMEEDTDIPRRNAAARRCALADIFQNVSPTEHSSLLRNYYTCLTVTSEHRHLQEENSTDADEKSTAATQQRLSYTVAQEKGSQIQKSIYIDHKRPLDNMFPTLSNSSHFVGGLRRALSLPDYDEFIFKSAKRCRRRNGLPDVSEGLSANELNSLRDRFFYRALVASV